jgi:hypothetical protein
MTILARDAKAGRRYRVSDTGDVIEICARPQDARNAELVPLTTEDGSFIHVNAVGSSNRKIAERDPAHPLVIPAFFRLEPFDGPYTEPPERRRPAPIPPRTGRSGRPSVRGYTPWMGWAASARHDMERVLEVVEEEGFWLKETFHHYKVGLGGDTCMAVFKSGQLGFRGRPDGPLGQFPAKKPTTEPWMGWKVDLGVVMAAERWDEMLGMLRRHLRDFRKRVERRRKREIK